MIEVRLASHIQAAALILLASAQGDFATIIKKGDPTSGSLLIIGQIRGIAMNLFERITSQDGFSIWQPVFNQPNETEDKISAYWQKRVARDPDLWVIELDVVDDERLNRLLLAST
jgi:hypothetical protein